MSTRTVDFSSVANPGRETDLSEAALKLMNDGIPANKAENFIAALEEGMDVKGLDDTRKISTLSKIISADTTKRRHFATAAAGAILQIDQTNRLATRVLDKCM
ncbi:MAG TPA: hypothetical protein PLK94_13200 [Alphaproteobacteria bacterium]|nr:hypothetical protein [Alphaproteobacteria bacterium]HOO52238.1 hypothetical protein [Alphaproteobacteria bacterium]